MIHIIEVQTNKNDSFFYKRLKNELGLKHTLFVFQKTSNIDKGVEYIPILDFTGKTEADVKNYFTAIARYIYTFIKDKKLVVLIINIPIHLLIAQYIKDKISIKLLYIADSQKNSYLKDLLNFGKDLNKDNDLIRVINDIYILADKICYRDLRFKEYIVKDLNIDFLKMIFIENIKRNTIDNQSFKSFFQLLVNQQSEIDHLKIRRHYFPLKAKEVLLKAKEVLEVASIPYWIDYGTLLGAVREKGFIANDLDIDIGILTDNFSLNIENKLKEQGFSKLAEYKLKGSPIVIQQTYLLHNVHIDLYFYQKKEHKISGYYFYFDTSFDLNMELYGGLHTVEVVFDFIGIDFINFLGTLFPVPRNYVHYLTEHYGANYLIPDSSWHYIRSPFNIKKIEKKGVVEY